MDERSFGGTLILILGIILILVSLWTNFVLAIYGVLIFIVGLIIIFNSKEDKIEQINYSKLKGRINNGKK